jgi:xanthine/uracil permease
MNPPSAIAPGTDPLHMIIGAAVVLVVLILLAIFLSGPIRRLVIFVANVFCTLIVILTTLFGGAAGWGGIKAAFPPATDAVVVAGTVFGAFLGFLIAAFLTAFLYLLIEIAENTRRSSDLSGIRPPPAS